MSKTITAEASGLDLFELFKSNNKESEENGKWLDLGSGTAFKVRAFHAKVVSERREELNKPYLTLQRAGIEIPDDKQEEIGLAVLGGAIIADWKGVKNAQGELVPYSEEEAIAILRALPKLGGIIMSFSLDAQQYKDEVVEEGAKNS